MFQPINLHLSKQFFNVLKRDIHVSADELLVLVIWPCQVKP